jgi:hypothetical protein
MPASLVHIQQPLVGLVRSQSLSPARLIFLISLVVFFTVLFVVTYVWMRKPGFGQHGGHEQATVSRETPAPDEQPRVDPDSRSGAMALPSIRTVDGLPVEAGPKVNGALAAPAKKRMSVVSIGLADPSTLMRSTCRSSMRPSNEWAESVQN